MRTCVVIEALGGLCHCFIKSVGLPIIVRPKKASLQKPPQNRGEQIQQHAQLEHMHAIIQEVLKGQAGHARLDARNLEQPGNEVQAVLWSPAHRDLPVNMIVDCINALQTIITIIITLGSHVTICLHHMQCICIYWAKTIMQSTNHGGIKSDL